MTYDEAMAELARRSVHVEPEQYVLPGWRGNRYYLRTSDGRPYGVVAVTIRPDDVKVVQLQRPSRRGGTLYSGDTPSLTLGQVIEKFMAMAAYEHA